MKEIVTWAILFMAQQDAWGRMMVQLPRQYTAMKGDVEVLYALDANSTDLKSFNAMIHIEYLPGDSVLTNSHTATSSIHLASLPIPMGVVEGSVVFSCGTITRAGPHRAVLTVGHQVEAVSPLLQVAWPPVSLRVPAWLETYATNVEIVVAFATTICTPLMRSPDLSHHPNNVIQKDHFGASLVLVECSKSLNYRGEGCQLPSKKDDPRVWYNVDLSHFLYTKSSFVETFNCSLWGQEGIFQVFLTTDLTHASIVERSSPIRVRTNQEYNLESYFSSTVLPCPPQDIRAIKVRRPQCAGVDDKIRVYGQGHRIVGGNVLPTDWRYYGEARVQDHIAVFHCELFQDVDDVSTFCFHYVSRSIIGTTNTTAKFCMPANQEDGVVEAKWGQWTKWSECRKTSQCIGTRSRHRFCMREPSRPKLICQGQPVEYKECRGEWSCTTAPSFVTKANLGKEEDRKKGRIWRPVSPEEANSPCACGCIYIVNGGRGGRHVDITSGEDCPSLPITWTIKASGRPQTDVRIEAVDFSCANSIMNVRQRHANGEEEMIYQTDRDVKNVTDVVTAAKAVTFTFHAPRRSCRINIMTFASSTQGEDNKDLQKQPEGIWLPHITTIVIVALAFLFVSVVSSLCIMCQFEYRRKKYLAWKSVPSSGYSTPTKTIECRTHVDTSTENLLSSPRPEELKRQRIKSALKRASVLIKDQMKSRKGRIRRSFSEAHVIDASYEMIPLVGSRLITGKIVRKALQIKSKRYKKGHFKPINRPRAPASTPTRTQKRSLSLSKIDGLLNISLPTSDPLPSAVETMQSGSEMSVQFHGSRRRRLLSKADKERLLERRNRRLINSVSNDSLVTLKATTSVSEMSYHSGDPELEFDLYDCDLNNVSALPGSMFQAPTIYYDLTPTGDEFEMNELFPMLRSTPDKNGAMVDSVTSDLTVSLTSDDLKYATFDRRQRDEDEETLYIETDNLLPKPKLLNLTHIEDEVSFVDE